MEKERNRKIERERQREREIQKDRKGEKWKERREERDHRAHSARGESRVASKDKGVWNAGSKKHAETGDSSCRSHNSDTILPSTFFLFPFVSANTTASRMATTTNLPSPIAASDTPPRRTMSR